MILYLIIINLIGIGVMALDKYKAEKSKWRISEMTLFLITFLGGGIGTVFGMYKFRHKTQKWYFAYRFSNYSSFRNFNYYNYDYKRIIIIFFIMVDNSEEMSYNV